MWKYNGCQELGKAACGNSLSLWPVAKTQKRSLLYCWELCTSDWMGLPPESMSSWGTLASHNNIQLPYLWFLKADKDSTFPVVCKGNHSWTTQNCQPLWLCYFSFTLKFPVWSSKHYMHPTVFNHVFVDGISCGASLITFFHASDYIHIITGSKIDYECFKEICWSVLSKLSYSGESVK